MPDLPSVLARQLWLLLGGDPEAVDAVRFTNVRTLLKAAFDISSLASACVATACLAAADLVSARRRSDLPPVNVDASLASASFARDLLVKPIGWDLPSLWDELAGNYRARNGWVRIHTNYTAHRAAALNVLGANPTRKSIAEAVASWGANEVEQAIVDSGGCAAVMHDATTWALHPHGRLAITEAPIIVRAEHAYQQTVFSSEQTGAIARPLDGVRVIDITRVIAGPVATWFLGAYGAQVLRIDPPGFREMPAVVPVTTGGKRCATLDLENGRDRRSFERLVQEAHVLVHGLRPGALEELGLGAAQLRLWNPSLIIASLDAYGWSGPWAGRRGFDSLVQMSCGIAAEGARQAAVDGPVPLPTQALDYATGYLLAAAICEAIANLIRKGSVSSVKASLVGAANVLMRLRSDSMAGGVSPWTDDLFESVSTFWGPMRTVRCPDGIAGFTPRFDISPGPIGRHDANWAGS